MNLFQVLGGRTPEEEALLREEAAATFGGINFGEYGGIDTIYTPDGQRRDFHAMPRDRYTADELQAALDANASRSAIRESIFDYVLEETGDLRKATDAARAADYTPALGTAIGLEEANIARQEIMPYIREGDYKSAGIEGFNTAVGVAEGLLAAVPVVGGALKTASRFAPKTSADAIGLTRSLLSGDLEGISDTFTRSRPPRSLSAAGVDYERSGADISEYLSQFPSAEEIVSGEPVVPMSNVTNITTQKPVALSQHRSTGILSDERLDPVERGTIAGLLGRDVMSIVGDQSGRHTVTSVNDMVFETPQKSLAGFEYTDIPGQGYAGALSATRSKLKEAERSVDPYVMSIMMGEKSSDFSLHEGMVFGEMMKSAQVDAKDVAKADEMIRNISKPETVVKRDADGNPMLNKDGSKKTQSVATKPYKDAPSVSDPRAMQEYIANLPSGTHRAYFLKGMDKATLHKLGIPKVQDARLAVADAAQLGMDWGTTGYRGFTPDVQKGVLETRPEQSTTYQYGYDKVEDRSDTYLSGSRGIPANLLFRNLAEEQRAKGTGGGLLMNSADYKVYEASPKRAKQRIEDIDVETVDSFLEVERRFGREAAMRFAQDILSGGKVTGKMIEKARKLNAPNWVIAAMVPMAAMQESEQ